MRCASRFFPADNRRLVAALALLFTTVFVIVASAQPANSSEGASTSSLLITNLQQLSKIIGSSSRVMADVRLDVLVCSTSRPEIGAVAVMDKRGGEILELGPREVSFVAGDVIRVEGRHCLLRRRE